MSLDSALALIESVKDDRVLFVGDAIIDEYHYVHPLGKSPKEHIIPARFIESESFAGGVTAAWNHAKSFCPRADMRMSLSAVRKVRFIERDYFRKVYEVHYDEGVGVNPYLDGDFDCVVVTDFGHGRITPDMVKRLCQMPYLAVNAQTNSSNIGFNLITKYPRADYIVIDEPEARLAAADREGHIEDVMHRLAHGRCERFVVTHGHHGSYGYDHGRFFRCPAFKHGVVDTMGAGDAFFAVTAPMSRKGEMEDLLMIGNAAGALKTQITGHRASVTKDALIAFLKEHDGTG